MKFLDETGLSKLWNKITTKFSLKGHTHTKSEISDLPTIVTQNVITDFWSGTQAEYDAITTKNSTTLYLITEEE